MSGAIARMYKRRVAGYRSIGHEPGESMARSGSSLRPDGLLPIDFVHDDALVDGIRDGCVESVEYLDQRLIVAET